MANAYKTFSLFFIFLVCVYFVSAQDSASVKNAERNYTAISFKKSVFQLGDICYEKRKNFKSLEISIGAKGLGIVPYSFLSALTRDFWNELYGPRINFLNKFYFKNSPRIYHGPSLGVTYLYFNGSYHQCDKCRRVSLEVNRVDFTLLYLLGFVNNLSKVRQFELNVGVGLRLMVINTKIVNPPLYATFENGAFSESLGKEYIFAYPSGMLNGLFLQPTVNVSWGFGGRIRKKN
jgi:hypothetical protein